MVRVPLVLFRIIGQCFINNMRKFILPSLLCIVFAGYAQQNALFKTIDHTKEDIFTNNIEGPAFDSKGNLYVVNFQKDGTIGLVKANGTVELFVTLPTGSTANSIQFDSKGNMFLADFTGHNVLKVDMK